MYVCRLILDYPSLDFILLNAMLEMIFVCILGGASGSCACAII